MDNLGLGSPLAMNCQLPPATSQLVPPADKDSAWKVPDDHPTEGTRLSIDTGGGEFDQEIGMRTVFVLTGPAGNRSPNPPAPSGETKGAPAGTRR